MHNMLEKLKIVLKSKKVQGLLLALLLAALEALGVTNLSGLFQ